MAEPAGRKDEQRDATAALTAHRYLDAATLMRLGTLELRARTIVNGTMSGIHRSPRHGFSVEFAEYRQYVDGDDPRFLDWRLYARSDRYFIKKFEEETNLRAHFLLDSSGSMGYGSRGYTKADYAKTLIATFAHFLARQRDAAGLMTFDTGLKEIVPARFRPGHLRQILMTLERAPETSHTDVAASLADAADMLHRRGMVVCVSDFLVPLDRLEQGVERLAARGHDVNLFQVLDPAEVDLDWNQAIRLRDLETGREMDVDASVVRGEYRERLAEHQQQLEQICLANGAGLELLRTDEPLELGLLQFIRRREQTARTAVTARRQANRW